MLLIQDRVRDFCSTHTFPKANPQQWSTFQKSSLLEKTDRRQRNSNQRLKIVWLPIRKRKPLPPLSAWL